jgi:amino acid transporter
MLLAVPRWIVFLLFLAFCIFLATRGVRTVKKFALVAAVTVGASAILLVLMSIPLFDLENLSLGGAILPDPTATAEIFVRKFAPLGVALAYFGCEVSARRETNGGNNGTYGNDDGDEAAKGNEPSKDNETDRNSETVRNRKTAPKSEVAQSSKKTPALTPLSAILGALLGGAFLILCYFNVMLLLGGESARGEEYPYSLAVGAISAGKLFMRMEAVSYAMYFLASTLRASVAVGLIWEFFKRVLVIRRETDG